MTMRANWTVASLMIALAMGWTCARGPGTTGAAQLEPGGRISCGLTGLGAGQGRGYIVHADGRVETWAGRTTAEGVAPQGIVPAGGVDSLWLSIRGADFFARNEQAVGGTAAFVAVETGERTHRLSWPVGPGTTPVDPVVQRVFDACERAAQSAR